MMQPRIYWYLPFKAAQQLAGPAGNALQQYDEEKGMQLKMERCWGILGGGLSLQTCGVPVVVTCHKHDCTASPAQNRSVYVACA